MYGKTKEEINAHLKRCKELEGQIKSRKGKFGRTRNTTKMDIFNILEGYEHAIEEKTEEIEGGLATYLKNNELPFDLMYNNIGPKKYFDITHNPNSPYSPVYDTESKMLLDLIDKKPEYITKNIIDIGCGDGIKIYEMLKKGLHEKKISGTVNYLGLDDSNAMLSFAKKNFYEKYHSKTQNKAENAYIGSDDIDPVMKKVHPRFQKARFQNIDGLEDKKPKTMLFLGGTFGNLPPEIQKEFLRDIKKMMGPDDVFVLSYFRILDQEKFKNKNTDNLIDNFFEHEKQRYKDQGAYHHEKNIYIKDLKDMLPGLEISQNDFDITMELNKEHQIIYDIKTFKNDIMYQGELAIKKGESFKSEGTKIDKKTLTENIDKDDVNKDFVENLYKGKETDDMIYSFLENVGIHRKDCFIDRTYDSKTGKLTISLVPLKPITFKWKENNKEIVIAKEKGEKIHIHTSKRFHDEKVVNIVQESGLSIVDEVDDFTPVAGQGTMKLLIIKNEK